MTIITTGITMGLITGIIITMITGIATGMITGMTIIITHIRRLIIHWGQNPSSIVKSQQNN